jgi:spermidine/putrescine transport system substrate-binding protein
VSARSNGHEEEQTVADQDLDSYLRRIAQAKVNRRGFLAASGLTASAAFLAACAGGSASASPSAAESAAASEAPSAAASEAPSAAASEGASPSPAAAVEKEFFLYNWSSYVAPENIEAFKKTFGVDKFTYDTYASNEEMMAKLQGGAKGQWDVAAPTAEFVPAMVEQGFLTKLEKSWIPNLANIGAAFKGLWWDPTDEYQVPKDWGTTGITVRKKYVSEEVKTWKEFFDVAPKYSGKIVVVDSPGDVFVAPLKALGYSLNSVDPGELEQARTLMMDLAPHVLALDSDQYQEKIRTGEAVLGLTWTGGILDLRDKPATADVVYEIPEDGTLFWMDTWVILADPPHPNGAYAFLNFIQDPQVAAKETSANLYASANDASKPYTDPKLLNDPALYPPADVMTKLEGAKDVSTDPTRAAIWEEFKSKIGQH